MLPRVVLWASLAPLLLTALPATGQPIQPHLDRSEQLFLDGRFEKAQALLDSVEVATADQMDPAARLLLAAQRSKIAVFEGIMSRERTHYEAALAMLRPHQNGLADVDDPTIRAAFMSALAYAHIFNTHIDPTHRDSALAQFQEAIQLYAETTDQAGEALARALAIMLRFTRHRTNRDTEAMLALIPAFETEIVFARRAGNPMALAYNQRHLAAIYREASGALDKALSLYQASLETRLQMGFRPFIPASYFSVAEVLADLGRTEAAIEMYEHSVKAADAVAFRRYQFASRMKLGDLLRTQSRLTLARSYYREALEVAEAGDFPEEADEARRKLDGLH